jgi:hypothetical protein
MSPFETAMRHCAELPHGFEKLNCLHSALLAHQIITVAAMGETDDGLSHQLEEIEKFLQFNRQSELCLLESADYQASHMPAAVRATKEVKRCTRLS